MRYLILILGALLADAAEPSRELVGRKQSGIVLPVNQTVTPSGIQVDLPGHRPQAIALSPDGKTLCTANGPTGDVSVVDLTTQTVIKKIKASGGPWGVIVVEP